MQDVCVAAADLSAARLPGWLRAGAGGRVQRQPGDPLGPRLLPQAVPHLATPSPVVTGDNN